MSLWLQDPEGAYHQLYRGGVLAIGNNGSNTVIHGWNELCQKVDELQYAPNGKLVSGSDYFTLHAVEVDATLEIIKKFQK